MKTRRISKKGIRVLALLIIGILVAGFSWMVPGVMITSAGLVLFAVYFGELTYEEEVEELDEKELKELDLKTKSSARR